MKHLGKPFIVQNTDSSNWLITWEDAVQTTQGESVSFTVAVPRSAHSLPSIQKATVERAIALLQEVLADVE